MSEPTDRPAAPPAHEPPAYAPPPSHDSRPTRETRSVKQVETKWQKLGKLAAEQAMPLIIGLVSLGVAVDAWFSARPLEWEKQRALASVETTSNVVVTGKGENEVVTTVKVTNVGQLTFAILEMKVDVELVGRLRAAWKDNSLTQSEGSALPIGLRPFAIASTSDSTHGHFLFDTTQKSWHVVDPGRSVGITFVQPLHGDGRMAISIDLYTQPIKLQSIASAIAVKEKVAGVDRGTMPEFGTGEVSDMNVFPYTSADMVVIPKSNP